MSESRSSVNIKDETWKSFRSALEKQWIRMCFTEPHVRVRPAAVRLTEAELVRGRPRERKRKRKRR